VDVPVRGAVGPPRYALSGVLIGWLGQLRTVVVMARGRSRGPDRGRGGLPSGPGGIPEVAPGCCVRLRQRSPDVAMNVRVPRWNANSASDPAPVSCRVETNRRWVYAASARRSFARAGHRAPDRGRPRRRRSRGPPRPATPAPARTADHPGPGSLSPGGARWRPGPIRGRCLSACSCLMASPVNRERWLSLGVIDGYHTVAVLGTGRPLPGRDDRGRRARAIDRYGRVRCCGLLRHRPGLLPA
jgi:hypothetical protein